MNRSMHRMVGLVMLVFVLLIAAACSSNESTKDGSKTNGEADVPPTEISIMTPFFAEQPPGKDNVIVKEVESRTNTRLKITWVSQNSYDEKVNVTVASGAIPDLMMVNDANGGSISQLIQEGAFWDLTPYIKDYPNLIGNLPKESWENSKVFGKNYGIVRARPLYGVTAMLIRKDWVEKLGLEMPESLDDLYNVLKAFRDGDPDNNGKNDTIPLGGNVTAQGMARFKWVENLYNETNGKWKLVNDELADTTLEPGTREALAWLRRAYGEHLIPPDFAIMKDSQNRDLIRSGKAGATDGAVSQSWVVGEGIRKIDPNSDYVPLPYLINENGNKISMQDSGVFGMFMIPTTVPEEKMKKILEFMDYGASEEGSTLANYGFKDIHYIEKDGFKLGTEQATIDNVAQQVFGQIFTYYDPYFRAYAVGMPKELYEYNKHVIDQMAPGIPDPAIGLHSPTDAKLGAEFDKKIMDVKVKVIMGTEPMEAWDKLVAELKADKDYQNVIQEINEAYKMNKK